MENPGAPTDAALGTSEVMDEVPAWITVTCASVEKPYMFSNADRVGPVFALTVNGTAAGPCMAENVPEIQLTGFCTSQRHALVDGVTLNDPFPPLVPNDAVLPGVICAEQGGLIWNMWVAVALLARITMEPVNICAVLLGETV